ncbi:type II secretion system F family protein [Thiomicrorhabdus aquaedulcis]|uniref:type II secretion system F family protein n=1 Tax=Thiomicrorhabdus aquaedulcis TaxID=2211106 RepID=UPI000FD79A0C|nr:type II secretion system F family protein [Thiomicrorhabdus aquaedulcis]
MIYKYEGFDASNRYIEGRMESSSEEDLSASLKKIGISLVEAKKIYFSSAGLKTRLSPNETIDLFKEILSLLKSGLKPLEAMEYISSYSMDSKKIRKIGYDAYTAMKNGSTMALALKEAGLPKKYFDVISVGELTGNIMTAFTIEIEQIELQLKIRKGFNTIYIAPAVSGVFMIIATIATIIFLAPMQRKIIDALVSDPSEIPPFSTAAFWIADYGIQSIIGFFVFLFGFFFIRKLLRSISEPIDVFFDLVSLSTPVFGVFYRNAEYAKISSILVLAMGSGNKQSTVMEIIKEQVSSPFFKKKLKEVYLMVKKEGYLVSDALARVEMNQLLVITLKRGEMMDRKEAASIVSDLSKEFEKKSLYNMEILKGASEMINMILLSVLSIPVLLISVAPAIDQVTLMMNRF